MCVNRRIVALEDKIRSVTTVWQFQVIERLSTHCKVDVDYMQDREISLDFL